MQGRKGSKKKGCNERSKKERMQGCKGGKIQGKEDAMKKGYKERRMQGWKEAKKKGCQEERVQERNDANNEWNKEERIKHWKDTKEEYRMQKKGVTVKPTDHRLPTDQTHRLKYLKCKLFSKTHRLTPQTQKYYIICQLV